MHTTLPNETGASRVLKYVYPFSKKKIYHKIDKLGSDGVAMVDWFNEIVQLYFFPLTPFNGVGLVLCMT